MAVFKQRKFLGSRCPGSDSPCGILGSSGHNSMANLRLARKNAETVKSFIAWTQKGKVINVIYNSIMLARDKASLPSNPSQRGSYCSRPSQFN